MAKYLPGLGDLEGLGLQDLEGLVTGQFRFAAIKLAVSGWGI